MDLVTQREGLQADHLRDKIVSADLTGRAFDDRWSTLPFVLRAQLFIIVPIWALYLFLSGTRETIARNIATDDLPSSEEILTQDESWERLDALLVHERDRNLIACIQKAHDAGPQRKKVGRNRLRSHPYAERHAIFVSEDEISRSEGRVVDGL